MRPEPSHRPTKRRRYNETPPLAIRIGAIREQLDARCDGTDSGYRTTIMRDLQRYWEMCNLEAHYIGMEWGEGAGQKLYREWQDNALDPLTTTGDYGVFLAIVDACERAHILVTQAGSTVDDALVAVGLVTKVEEEK